jgi:DNA-binding response OmpR family regulator
MEADSRQSILIIESNEQIREEIFNFLLSAGYEKTEETDYPAAALDKIRQSRYEIIVADAGALLSDGLGITTDIARLSHGARLILMINAEDRQSWDQLAARLVDVRFLIKTEFARNLLYLLEENAQP